MEVDGSNENDVSHKIHNPPNHPWAQTQFQIRNPNGGAAVELSHNHLQRILAETSQPTSMVIILIILIIYPCWDESIKWWLYACQEYGESIDGKKIIYFHDIHALAEYRLYQLYLPFKLLNKDQRI